MIKKVNQETYIKVLKELMLQRVETTFWKWEYERQYWNTLGLLIICLGELAFIIWFILFTK